MEEKAKPDHDPHSQIWAELQEKAKDDPEFARKLEVAKHVTERYREAFERLADC